MKPMTMSEIFIDLSNRIEFGNEEQIINELATHFGFDHMAYVAVGVPQKKASEPLILTTYDQEWNDFYKKRKFQYVDPVITIGMQSLLPLNWHPISENSNVTKSFFNAASEFGISRYGLSVPVRGLYGERAIFSINVDTKKREWDNICRAIISDITYCAYLVHNFILERKLPKETIEPIKLTPREYEVLHWVSEGKTAWETGEIIGLAEGTINFYLKNIYAKLNVSNKAQAVTKALKKGLI